jgi:hypothetical protein
MTLYVYFKFFVSDHPMIAGSIREMQEQLLLEYPSLDCDLLKRPHADEEGRETWMEVYRGVASEPSQFIERLKELAFKNDLPQPRRNEIFISID